MVKGRVIFSLLSILFCLSSCRGQSNSQNSTNDISNISNLEIPQLVQDRPEQILYRKGYTASYNQNTKNANWVAWHLTSEHTDGPNKRKGISYMVDEEVVGGRQELVDWYNHGLDIDHGHLCPAGDNKWDREAMAQTFLLSNMCPQNSNLNQGMWENLESRCRGWARQYGEIFIATGPIFYSDNYRTIGPNQVGVPDAFYKVILALNKKPKAIGFIMPNITPEYSNLKPYVVTVDRIEEITGIDFFYNLPDDIENVIEAEADFDVWH